MIKRILATLLALLAAVAFAATDVNTASQAELEAVKGIGPSLSTKILDARKTGPFKDWGDLVTRVKGVGDKNSDKLSAAGLTVNGAAKSGAPADPSMVRKADKAAPGTAAKAMPRSTTATTAAPPVTSTSPAATPATTTGAAVATSPAAAVAAASAPMSAADKKAARKAAKEERARLKAADSAGAAAAGASTPAHQ